MPYCNILVQVVYYSQVKRTRQNKNELGTIKIYSSDKQQLIKLQTMYFEGNKKTKIKIEDTYGKPIYYLKSNIGKKHFKYAKNLFLKKKQKILLNNSKKI